MAFTPGLQGVIAVESSISSIDGKKGILRYRGFKIEDLASHSNFEEVTYLLWFGKLPNKSELSKFTKKLRAQRDVPNDVLHILKKCPKHITAMDALRTCTSYLAHCDPDLNKHDINAKLRKGIRLTAKFPTIVAAYWRIRNGQRPIAPDPKLSHGANFLYMLHGKRPSEIEAQAVELDMILTAEHELNASTFATRIATSTLADLHSAVVAGISTLKGPLHGGAREKVYDMLDQVKTPKNANKYVKDRLKKKQVIMGFGHRVYKTYDPRAKILKTSAKKLANHFGNQRWYDISTGLEDVVQKVVVEKMGKPVYPNVDFWTGAVYKYLKIPHGLSTSIFPLGRIVGWTAHAIEQSQNNRLIRPASRYVGATNQKYVLLRGRK